MEILQHDSDCALHNEPAMPNGPCDCSANVPGQGQLPTRRMSRKPGETFLASPLATENSWRVLGNHGTVEAFRVSEIQAEDLAARLNALPVD